MNSYERFLDALREAGCHVDDRGHRAAAQAPGHSPADRSISILYNATEGRTVFESFADDKHDVLDQLGLGMKDLFDNPSGTEYRYGDGRVVHRSPDKKFRQTGNTKGTSLFHADKLAEADTVYFVEGEHDVLTLEQEGVTATCTAMGAGKAHLFDLTPLHGKTVVIVQDLDKPGSAHAQQVAELLAPHASVSIVSPKAGKDATDHIVAGHTVEDFTPSTTPDSLAFAPVAKALDDAQKMSLADGIEHIRSALARIIPTDATIGPKPMSYWIDQWQEWAERPAGDGAGRVMPTPWPELNDTLADGFHAGRSYVIAGRPGAGKSLGLLNFASYASMRGRRGVVYSVEMGGVEVTSRIISSETKIEYKSITRRLFTREDYGMIGEALDDLAPMPLYISDKSAITMPRIASEARRMKEDGGLDFIAIDYMQLLKSNNPDRQKALTDISREVKVLAGELDVAMISACQLNRGNAKDRRRPMLSDLRESGAIEQDCDVAILLHHPELPDGSPTGEVELIVAKNRTGPMRTVVVPWRPHYARIGGDPE